MLRRLAALAALLAATVAIPAAESDPLASLKAEPVTLKSAGPLAFGPAGILFVGDPAAAAVYAIDTGDRTPSEATARPKVEDLGEKVATLLGTEAKQVQIKDLAVNPVSGKAYLSVLRGAGASAAPVIVRVDRAGKVEELKLEGVKSARATIPNAAEGKSRQEAITHLGYVKGRVVIAGLSNEEFASTLRAIPFPFDKVGKGTSVEIYHGAHGKFETRSPIRVFAPYKIGDEDHLLAAYTCTPLVKFPVAKLEPGLKIKGTTVAELGNRNRPLSMIVYNKGGKDFVLLANNARGLMKIPLEGVDKIEGITARVSDKAGLGYETIKDLSGVQKLDAYGKTHAAILVQAKDGKLTLDTVELP